MDGNASLEGAVRSLAAVLREERLAEISLETETEHLRVRRRRGRGGGGGSGTALVAESPEAARAREEGTAVPVTSPCVGTLHLSNPRRGGEPAAPLDDLVRAGQVVAWVDNLGMHQEVPAPREGRVVEILVHEGEPVEYGQVLLILQTVPPEA